MGDEMNSTRNFCTLSKVEKLRIALDVSRGMKHITERNVSKETVYHVRICSSLMNFNQPHLHSISVQC